MRATVAQKKGRHSAYRRAKVENSIYLGRGVFSYMHVCMCMYVCSYMSVRVCVCIYIYIYNWGVIILNHRNSVQYTSVPWYGILTYICIHTYIHIYVCMYVCIYVCMYVAICQYVCVYIYIYIIEVCLYSVAAIRFRTLQFPDMASWRIYVYIHDYACMYVCMYACM